MKVVGLHLTRKALTRYTSSYRGTDNYPTHYSPEGKVLA